MGLNTSHDCWHGPYSSFHNFRKKICEVAGYGDLDNRIGFSYDRPGIPWPGVDPIEFLLDHSDCDGIIESEKCSAIADSLERLIPSLERAEDTGGHCGYYADLARKFIAGLRDAAIKNEDVDFH